MENEETRKKIEKIRSKIDFQLNKNEKNKKFVEKKLVNLGQKEKLKDKEKENNNNNKENDMDIDDDNEIIDNEKNEKFEEKKSKKNKTIDHREKEGNRNKDWKNKNKNSKKDIKKMKSAYDYELDVQNFEGLENDDFFIVE